MRSLEGSSYLSTGLQDVIEILLSGYDIASQTTAIFKGENVWKFKEVMAESLGTALDMLARTKN